MNYSNKSAEEYLASLIGHQGAAYLPTFRAPSSKRSVPANSKRSAPVNGRRRRSSILDDPSISEASLERSVQGRRQPITPIEFVPPLKSPSPRIQQVEFTHQSSTIELRMDKVESMLQDLVCSNKALVEAVQRPSKASRDPIEALRTTSLAGRLERIEAQLEKLSRNNGTARSVPHHDDFVNGSHIVALAHHHTVCEDLEEKKPTDHTSGSPKELSVFKLGDRVKISTTSETGTVLEANWVDSSLKAKTLSQQESILVRLDKGFSIGDTVRVMKKGTYTGRECKVVDPDWSDGRVKVELNGQIKSYLATELDPVKSVDGGVVISTRKYLPSQLEMLDEPNEIAKAGGLLHKALVRWGVSNMFQAWMRWRRLFVPKFEITAWHSIYSIIDADGSGKIDGEELAKTTEEFGMALDREKINQVISLFDVNMDGELDEQEFLDLMTMVYFKSDRSALEVDEVAAEKNKWEFQFNYLDSTNPSGQPIGSLGIEQAVALFNFAGFDFTQKQVIKIYTKFSIPGAENHKLTFHQFVEMIQEVKENKELQEEIIALTTSLYDRYKSGAYTIDENSPRLFYWNLGTTLLVIYSAVIVPTRLAFDSTPSVLTLGLDYFMELWFLFDIVISFHTCHVDMYTTESHSDLETIRYHYLRSWFAVDVLSSIPTAFITLVYAKASQLGVLRILRMVKIFRIIKLLKLKTFKELEESGIINPAIVRLVKIIIWCVVSLHWLACVYWTVAATSCASGVGTEDFNFIFCPDEWRLGFTSADDQFRTDFWEKYFPALYWSIAVMLGNHMDPRTNSQYRATSVMLILGIALFSAILGGLTSFMASWDARNAAKAEQMNSINAYLAFQKVDKEICTKIRSYYNYLWSSGQSKQQRSLFEELPARLALELKVILKEKLLISVHLFRGLQPKTLLGIMEALEPKLLMPGTVVIRQGEVGENMYIVNRGRFGVFVRVQMNDTGNFEEKDMGVLTHGACFGELSMFGDNKRTATIRALRYGEIEILAFEELHHLASQFPDLLHALQSYAKTKYRNQRKAQRDAEARNTAEALAARMREQKRLSTSRDIKRDSHSWDQEKGISRQHSKRLSRKYTTEQIELIQSMYVATRDHGSVDSKSPKARSQKIVPGNDILTPSCPPTMGVNLSSPSPRSSRRNRSIRLNSALKDITE